MRFPLARAGSGVHKPRRQCTKNWPRPPYSLFTWKLKLPWETRWLWELFVVSIWVCISTDKSTGQVFRNRITRELSLGLDELEIQQFSVTACTGTTKSNKHMYNAGNMSLESKHKNVYCWAACHCQQYKNTYSIATKMQQHVTFVLLHMLLSTI